MMEVTIICMILLNVIPIGRSIGIFKNFEIRFLYSARYDQNV